MLEFAGSKSLFNLRYRKFVVVVVVVRMANCKKRMWLQNPDSEETLIIVVLL
jgi:hypothetical protein